jgi:dTDP-4-amino-4,6-dideoxygalactose transaminase
MKRPLTAHDRLKLLSRTRTDPVPALRPQLPSAERLLPYLERIDAARKYTNWGPLACELESRLCQQFGLPEHSVISAASGTMALVGATLAAAGRATPRRPLAIVPAFTFVATAIAVEQCGYTPYLADIDPETWLLDPESLADESILSNVGLVVPVSTFGRAVRQDAWADFRSRTGIPVVIDGAATFESVSSNATELIGAIPVAMSFHATKSFGTGEGGCVLTTDEKLAMQVTRALNFGFFGNRTSCSASTNGKMSEYHAAVGLAELDGWARKSAALQEVATRYHQELRRFDIADQLLTAPAISSCYLLFVCSDPVQATRVQRGLTDSSVEYRLWYGRGLLQEPYFSALRHGQLAITNSIAPLVIGLPVATDLSDSTLKAIASAVRAAVLEKS